MSALQSFAWSAVGAHDLCGGCTFLDAVVAAFWAAEIMSTYAQCNFAPNTGMNFAPGQNPSSCYGFTRQKRSEPLAEGLVSVAEHTAQLI